MTVSPPNTSSPGDEDQQMFMAAQVLGNLRNSSSPQPSSTSNSSNIATNITLPPINPPPNQTDNTTTDSTLLDKVVTYPLISQSINYMLEKTIQTANIYVKESDPVHMINSTTTPITINSLNNLNNLNSISPTSSKKRNSFHNDDEIFKKPRLSASSSTNSIISMTNTPPISLPSTSNTIPPNPLTNNPPNSSHFFPRNPSIHRLNPPQYLRKQNQSQYQSNISPKTLNDIKEIGIINLNIESRKRLNMLINFLKIGNNQISNRIENLIRLIELQKQLEDEKQKQKIKASEKDEKDEKDEFFDASEDLNHLTAVNSRTDESKLDTESDSTVCFSSDTPTPDLEDKVNQKEAMADNVSLSSSQKEIPMQLIKDDIIGTVKKIVNVISKVSANSLPEPARSNVREALLRLPSNWAYALEEDEEEEEEEESNEKKNGEKDDDTMSVSSTSSQKTTKNRSLAQKLLSNLFKYNKMFQNSYYKRRANQPQQSSKLSSFFYTNNGSNETDNDQDKDMESTNSWAWLVESQLNYNMQKNGRILLLAQESLDMINKVIKFCNDSLDKADHWNQVKTNQQHFNLLSKLETMESTSSSSTIDDSSMAGDVNIPPLAATSSSTSTFTTESNTTDDVTD